MTLPVIIVHGGATVFKELHHEEILIAIEKAALTGLSAMDKGGSAVDAVESSIWVLEETDLFTAGRGACENLDGDIEVDAMIMDGNRLDSGAVMAVRDIIHPISLARYVLERTPVMQIVGTGATRLYNNMIAEGYRKESELLRTMNIPIAHENDTVGCVAVDSNGHIASGSSTSGWPGKLPGRIGDSPIIGSGVYANELAGASCTGKGEQILRIVMGRMAVAYVENGVTVQEACHQSVRVLRDRTPGEGGLIMADYNGNLGLAFDTPHMPTAIAKDGKVAYSSMTPAINGK
ncbi:MAG: isoaspartyl peptidase/L-asparaginase [Candidatus Thorarchaeota archaeon]|nr:isoaspartyl peptidase/L-asparaginase [Candidatus Thorarchaeota archaeon]